MTFTAEGLTILTFLIPGLMSSSVLSALIVRRDMDVLARVVEALVLSFVIYATSAAILGGASALPIRATLRSGVDLSINFDPRATLCAVLLAVTFGLVLAVLARMDVVMAALRRLRITNLTGYDNIWHNLFTREQRYVIVNLRNGRRVFGWPMYCSNRPTDAMLYLYGPAWIDSNQHYIELDLHGMLLSRSDIDTIEFTHLTRATAREAPPKERPDAT